VTSLVTEETKVADLESDSDTYYGKASRRGLLQFICNHLLEIRSDGSRTVIITSVATFIFVFTDNHIVVRCDPRDRTTKECQFPNQDFSEIQRCASGEYRTRESLLTTDADIRAERILNRVLDTGPVSWSSIPVNAVLLYRHLDHPDCFRFMTFAYHQQIDVMARFADEILTAMDYVAPQQAESRVVQDLAQSFQLFQALRIKRILNQRDLELIIITATQICLPPQARTGMPNPDTRERTLNPFEIRLLDMWTELEMVYEQSLSRQTLQDRMVALFDTDPEVVVAQGVLGLIVKANADFLTSRSVVIDDRWLNLLRFTSDHDYLLVG
jgi:hypothetical protein